MLIFKKHIIGSTKPTLINVEIVKTRGNLHQIRLPDGTQPDIWYGQESFQTLEDSFTYGQFQILARMIWLKMTATVHQQKHARWAVINGEFVAKYDSLRSLAQKGLLTERNGVYHLADAIENYRAAFIDYLISKRTDEIEASAQLIPMGKTAHDLAVEEWQSKYSDV